MTNGTEAALVVTTQSQQVGALAGMATSTTITAIQLQLAKILPIVISPVKQVDLVRLQANIIGSLIDLEIRLPPPYPAVSNVALYLMSFPDLPGVPFVGCVNDSILDTPPSHPYRYCNLALAETVVVFLRSLNLPQMCKHLEVGQSALRYVFALNSPTAFCLLRLAVDTQRSYKLIYRNGSLLVPIVKKPEWFHVLCSGDAENDKPDLNVNANAYRCADGIVGGIGMDEFYGPITYDGRVPPAAYEEVRRYYQEKAAADLVLKMRQPVLPVFDPQSSSALSKNGCIKLDQQSIGDPLRVLEFKQHNRRALERIYGLAVRPDALLISSVNRLETSHKCNFAMLAAAGHLLERMPHLQFMLAGNVHYASGSEASQYRLRAAELVARFPGRACVLFEQLAQDEVARVLAGSDFHLLLSVAEVFANIFSESLALGAIPLVSDRPPMGMLCREGGIGKILTANAFDPWSYARTCRQWLESESADEQAKLRSNLDTAELQLADALQQALSGYDGDLESLEKHQWRSLVYFINNFSMEEAALKLRAFLKRTIERNP